jgi:hypothetical protein
VTFTSEARVRMPNSRKYALQVGKHWAHNLHVEERGEAIAITFPKDTRGADWPGEAVVTLTPEADALICRIDASAPGQRDGLKDAVARHVDRFAFREDPLQYDWQDQ